MSRKPVLRPVADKRFAPMPLPSGNRPHRHRAYLAQALGSPVHADEPLHLTWFAGGGGSSEGAKQHLGRDVDYALNHDAVALRMHEVNHPGAITWCCDAYAASPLEVEPGRPIGTMWFSPDCTDHSKAKGGVPKSPRIRGLAWSIIPWAKLRRPSVIMFENVEEWWDWGPLHADGHADKARRGETRARFVKRLAQCGYTGEFRELVTADYGGETTRKRLFGIFRCDGQPIVWPERTHAPRHLAAKLGLKPWVGAATFIDFNRPCPSIFLTQADAKAQGLRVKRPLVKATRRRIGQGVKRFVIEAADPFLVQITHQGGDRVYSVREPINTVTGANRGEFAIATPLLVGTAFGDGRERAGLRAWPLDGPVRTQTGSPNEALVAPTITPFLFGCGGRRGQSPAIGADNPAPTMTGKADTWLAAAYLVPRYGEREGQEPRALSVEQPFPTVTPDANGGRLVSAYLSRQFGSTVSGRSLEEPHPTVMTEGDGGKSGVVAVALDRAYGKSAPADPGEPLKGVSGHSHDGLIAVHLSTYYNTGIGSDCADPIRVVTGEDRHGLVSAFLEQANTGMVGHAADEPLSTLCGRGTTQRLIEVGLQAFGVEPGSRRRDVLDFLWEEFGAPTEAEWADPTGTLAARLKFGFVILGDQVWEIADIGMRMLSVRELFRAQTFPADYIIDRDIHGRPITGTAATLMCGNAVPPLMAKLLYAGNWPLPEAREMAA